MKKSEKEHEDTVPTETRIRKSVQNLFIPEKRFMGDDGNVYVELENGPFSGTNQILSNAAIRYTQHKLYKKFSCVVPDNAIKKLLTELMLMMLDSKPYKLNVRSCLYKNVVYIDRGDGTCYMVSPDWVKIVRTKNVKFKQRKTALPLPAYVPGDETDINKLAAYVPREYLPLVVAYIAMCLIAEPPFANLVVQGEHKSGKSILCQIIRALTDPSKVPTPSVSKVDDLFVNAVSNSVVGMDNISILSDEMSDNMCRLSSDGSFAKRKLYTDTDEIALKIPRPILVNGIDSFVHRSDLADRSIFIHLKRVKHLMADDVLWSQFNTDAPKIFGAILQGISHYLCVKDSIDASTDFRVISFTRLGMALESAFGWDTGTFLHALKSMKRRQLLDEVESSSLAKAIVLLITHRKKDWVGCASTLFAQFDDDKLYAPFRKDAHFPKSGVQMGKQLTRIKPLLRDIGIEVKKKRNATKRTIVLSKTKKFNPINF